jgi:hypothetical protein
MATSKRWPILHEMANGRKRPLLPRAEGLGCAHWGIPVPPWKQRRQNEREAGGRG